MLNNFDNGVFDTKRLKANKQLCEILLKLVNENTNLRFNQILENFSFIFSSKDEFGRSFTISPYYEEPTVTLERVLKATTELGNILYSEGKNES